MVWSRRRWKISHRRQRQEFMTPFKYSHEGSQKVELILRKHGFIHKFITMQATSLTWKMPKASWQLSWPQLAKTFSPSGGRKQESLQAYDSWWWFQSCTAFQKWLLHRSPANHHRLFKKQKLDRSKQEKPRDRRTFFKISSLNWFSTFQRAMMDFILASEL